MTAQITFEDSLLRNRRRVWLLCYRMIGSRADADDLAQDAMARALERAGQARDADAVGWLLRLTTTLCIDHLRRKKIERRLTELVDPLAGPDFSIGESGPEDSVILREDLRFAVMVALQRLSAPQRAVLILHDVCDRSLHEVAETMGSNANATKAMLHRARVALAEARRHDRVDVPVDPAVVEKFARAVAAGAIDELSALLAPDVWGITDGGGLIVTANKPSYGPRAVTRQWANAKRKVSAAVTADIVPMNGEPTIVIRLAELPEMIVAVVHFETWNGRVRSLRVGRDPRRFPVWPRTSPTGP
jgi:RNA polymerase sigma-70 factor (ECF subfamily)